MTDDYTNPLVRFGVPKWLAQEALGIIDSKGCDAQAHEQTLKEVQGAAQAVYRRLSRIFHPDNGSRPDADKFASLSSEIEQLDDLDAVEVFARDLVDTGSIYSQQAQEMARQRAAMAHDRLHALMGMLPAVSPFEVLGSDEPMEIVLGLPNSFADDYNTMFNQTFFVQPKQGPSPVYRGPHPLEEDFTLTKVFDASFPLHWRDGAWVMEHYDLDPDTQPVPQVHRFAPELYAHANLVGGVAAKDVFMLGARLRSLADPDARQITGGNAPKRPTTGLTWLPADRAWWLTHIKPTLNQGDYAVLARVQGNQLTLALGGALITARSLNTQ